MNQLIVGLTVLSLLGKPGEVTTPGNSLVAQANYSLENRYSNAFVNNVFSDNILLTLAYMRGVAKKGEPIDWTKVREPFTYRLVLKPGETFAFHDRLLPEFEGKVASTTNAHFNSAEGFKSDGFLVGDGVCHLASFMNVVAREAGLSVVAPSLHSIAKIESVPDEYGVSIYYDPNGVGSSAAHNLYITNNQTGEVAMIFTHEGDNLYISVEKDSTFTFGGNSLTL